MTIIRARTTVAMALILASGVALADGFEFQKGLYVGASTGASFVTGQTQSRLVERSLTGPVINASREEASARGYNGSVILGWDFYSDNQYIYGLVASANAYTNKAYQTWSTTVETTPINFQDTWNMQYSADLSFKPGVFISDTTELYALMGASLGRIDTELKNLNTNETVHKNKAIYGFVLGTGVQKQLCNRLSLFASYQYTYYGKKHYEQNAQTTILLPLEVPTPIAVYVTQRDLRIDTNIFKIGLIYTF